MRPDRMSASIRFVSGWDMTDLPVTPGEVLEVLDPPALCLSVGPDALLVVLGLSPRAWSSAETAILKPTSFVDGPRANMAFAFLAKPVGKPCALLVR